MNIRTKIMLAVMPIILTTSILVGAASYFSATSGLNSIARSFLGFKVSELERYADSQWSLVVENGYTQKPEFIDAVKMSIAVYSKNLVLSNSEVILALDAQGALVQSTEPIELKDGEGTNILSSLKLKPQDLLDVHAAGQRIIARGFYFAALDWYFVIADTAKSFYAATDQITIQTAIILSIALLVGAIILFWLAGTLTRPIRNVVRSMRTIIESGELDKMVTVEYPDETGTLAHTFNIMTAELEKAQKQIKSFAYQAVLAQKNEQRLKNVFQRYVPQQVIDSVVNRPESALVGEERVLAVLFSDIRSFTTISESMAPSDLVQSLNQYFGYMVDIIVAGGGIIDKYIGDAIMAFYGAPIQHKEDAYQSVMAAIQMSEKVKVFNAEQIKRGKPPFYIGIGINYGNVTVGNIGTEKKMDYTVIGDNVNLASRLEGLTKEYHSEIVISEFLWESVQDRVNWRLLDAVKVKGKNKGVKIFGVKGELDNQEKDGWAYHNEAMHLYFARHFSKADGIFTKAQQHMPLDPNLQEMRERCQEYLIHPPPEQWDGAKVMKTK